MLLLLLVLIMIILLVLRNRLILSMLLLISLIKGLLFIRLFQAKQACIVVCALLLEGLMLLHLVHQLVNELMSR